MNVNNFSCINSYDIIWEILHNFPEFNNNYNLCFDLLENYCDSIGSFEKISFCYTPKYKHDVMLYGKSDFDKYMLYIFNKFFPEEETIIIQW